MDRKGTKEVGGGIVPPSVSPQAKKCSGQGSLVDYAGHSLCTKPKERVVQCLVEQSKYWSGLLLARLD